MKCVGKLGNYGILNLDCGFEMVDLIPKEGEVRRHWCPICKLLIVEKIGHIESFEVNFDVGLINDKE